MSDAPNPSSQDQEPAEGSRETVEEAIRQATEAAPAEGVLDETNPDPPEADEPG